MRILVNNGPVVRRLVAAGYGDLLGHLFTPRGGALTTHLDLPVALDNGAFLGFDPDAFRRHAAALATHPRLLWVACPDVVADAAATRALFDAWAPELAAVPLAYVLQDGATMQTVPWDGIAAVFIGGSTAWKLGPEAADIVREAHFRGKWVHMGRVNTMRRLRIAYDLGCHSVDGSKLTRWSATHLPRALAEVRWLTHQVRFHVQHPNGEEPTV
jgi:hypothetical protein